MPTSVHSIDGERLHHRVSHCVYRPMGMRGHVSVCPLRIKTAPFPWRDLDPSSGSLNPTSRHLDQFISFVWSTNKSNRQTDRQTDRATCSVTMRATRQKNCTILQQLRFVRALTVNLSCQSTADTSVDVCGEEMSSDSSLLRFGRAVAT